MKNAPSSPERSANWLSRAAIIALLSIGGPACQTDQQKSQAEVAEGASISNEKAIQSAKQSVKEHFEKGFRKVGIAPRNIVKGEVSRLGDENWDLIFARATLNSTGEYPAAHSASPENTTVVYLTLESGAGIVVALDEKTGKFISMDGDN